MIKNGLIHIYTGNGKGKTTAAVGLAVRCAGAGNQVLFVQFMKGMQTSETGPLKQLGIKIIRKENMTKFIFAMTDEEKLQYKKDQEDCFSFAQNHCHEYDMIIFDEVFGAITTGMIKEQALLDFLNRKPSGLEIVLTGRDAREPVLSRADYVSEIKAIKHPYDNGVEARKGIEF